MDTTVWREFPLVDDDAEGGANVVARLTALLGIATRLEAVGWPTRLTTTGLAFQGPAEGAADELLRLGVEEPFTDMPSRTLVEVCAAVGRLHDALRERGLDAEEVGQLSALHWMLGVDAPGGEPEGLALQVDAVSPP